MVEVGLIAHFVMALGNPTVSASILITGMLVFSGLGALVSERILPIMRWFMPALFLVVGGAADRLRALSQPSRSTRSARCPTWRGWRGASPSSRRRPS